MITRVGRWQAPLLGAMVFALQGALCALEPVTPFFVEGYAGQLSLVAGEKVALHVSTSESQFACEIARLGSKREVVWSRDKLPGAQHPVPEKASAEGCQWPVSLEVPISPDWRSGYYQVVFKVSDNGGDWTQRSSRTATSEAFFVVRASTPGSRSRILLQLACNTYNAYNNWGGFSLYAYHGRGGNQGHRVSFDRPPRSQFSRWELPFVQWAENAGFEIEYAVNSDLEFHPEILKAYRLVLSVGHDEYWSAPMRDHLETFISQGGNVAFLSGNTCCWQVRSEANGRNLACWKQDYHQDPVFKTGDFSTLTSLWSHHLIGRPENQLTGVGFIYGGYHRSHGQHMDGSGGFTVHRPGHWLFEGTQLKQDQEFGGAHTIVGYECDGCELVWENGLPSPTHRDGTPRNFQVLATAPATWHPDDAEWYEKWEKGHTGHAVVGVYERGGTVVTVGTTDWAHGLAGKDPAVDRITRNILNRLGK